MNSSKKLPLIIIMGPTGVGKSDFALELAQKVSGEIVNCDVGQFYTPLSIGTAKPENWQQSPILHHLFDIISEPRNFSVTEFRKQVSHIIDEIRSRQHIPIIVGGSGFYVNALFYPPIDEQGNTSKVTKVSWEQLQQIDPVRAQQIHPHDTYRIERALQIWEQTGQLPSQQKPFFKPVSDNFIIVHVERDREELYARINARTETMLAQGWIEEVKKLPIAWHAFLCKKKIIGYLEIISFLNSPAASYNELIAAIQQATRHYAKRQMTFWRMLAKKLQNASNNASSGAFGDGTIMQVNLTLSPVNLYIRQLTEKISYLSR